MHFAHQGKDMGFIISAWVAAILYALSLFVAAAIYVFGGKPADGSNHCAPPIPTRHSRSAVPFRPGLSVRSFRSIEPVVIQITRDEVEPIDTSRVVAILDSFIPDLLERNRKRISMEVLGYHGDKRELYDIPAVRAC